MNDVRFRLRDEFLPEPGQTYLAFPGVRPDRGHCPGCGAFENMYCNPGCALVDPYAKDSATRLRRCLRCTVAEERRPYRADTVILLPKRGVRHLVTPDLDISLCHMVTVRHGGLILAGIRW